MELENKIAIGLVKEFYDAIEETDFHVPEFITGIPMADGSEEYGKILEEETFELAKTNAIICIKRMLNNRVSYPYPQEINVEINGIINMINYPTVFWTKVLDIVKELKSI